MRNPITKKAFIDFSCTKGIFFAGVYKYTDIEILEEKVHTIDHTLKPRTICKKTSAGFMRGTSEYRHEVGNSYYEDTKAFYVLENNNNPDVLIYIK